MIVFISNYYNHHQSPFSNAMYRITDGQYRFIATIPMAAERLQMGWKEEEAPFIEKYYEEPEKCRELLDNADVVICGGSAPSKLVQTRLKAGKMTFRYSERLYRPMYTYPLALMRLVKYRLEWGRYKQAYLLCAGAYAAGDYALSGIFVDKAYKWGYFPEVKKYDLEELMSRKGGDGTVSILWAGRLMSLKRPDSAVRLAKYLKEKGYKFEFNIIGNGEMEQRLKDMISEYNLQDCVHMLGKMSPEQVRDHMENADIFLFTSNRNEGWGAVLNESMNSGCAVVACRAIGSVPFVIKDGTNGLIYDKEEDLYEKVEALINDADLRQNMAKEAYKTMTELWNADDASVRLLQLMEELEKNGECGLFEDGPCSPAKRIFLTKNRKRR